MKYTIILLTLLLSLYSTAIYANKIVSSKTVQNRKNFNDIISNNTFSSTKSTKTIDHKARNIPKQNPDEIIKEVLIELNRRKDICFENGVEFYYRFEGNSEYKFSSFCVNRFSPGKILLFERNIKNSHGCLVENSIDEECLKKIENSLFTKVVKENNENDHKEITFTTHHDNYKKTTKAIIAFPHNHLYENKFENVAYSLKTLVTFKSLLYTCYERGGEEFYYYNDKSDDNKFTGDAVCLKYIGKKQEIINIGYTAKNELCKSVRTVFECIKNWEKVDINQYYNKERTNDCWAYEFGYYCCPEDTDLVFNSELDSNLWYGVHDREWCGIKENSKNHEVNTCWSVEYGYKCCKSSDTKPYEPFDKSNIDERWYGIENNEWCGLYIENFNEECWSNKFGYPCCQSNDVVPSYPLSYDSTKWYGVENGNWCGILNIPTCNYCEVVSEDTIQWGFENNKYCFIPNSCN